MPLVLGVDSSARSTVVEVRDADSGELVASGRAPHPSTPGPEREQDPSAWWSALLGAIAQTGQRDIAAMSVAAQQHGLVVTDSAGAVLRSAILASDHSARRHVANLVTQYGSERWAKTVGLVPDAATTISKLAWLKTAEPATFARVGHVLLAHDWITFRLTGRMVTDRGDASGTGYWSPRHGTWHPDLLHRLDVSISEEEWRSRLPEVLGPSALADWMTASVHEIVGLRGRPIVASGTGRLMASALGIGLDTGEIAVSLDPGGGVFVRSMTAVADPTGQIRGFADATGRFLPFSPLHDAMSTTMTVARVLRTDHQTLNRLARRCPPGAGGTVVAPGTSYQRMSILNVGAEATPEQVARAAFEGVVCATLDEVETIAKAGGSGLTGGPLRLVGQASQSPAYRQIFADLSGMPVVASPSAGAVVHGACAQAAAALGDVSPDAIFDAWGLRAGTITEPDESVDRAAIREYFAHVRDTGGRPPGT